MDSEEASSNVKGLFCSTKKEQQQKKLSCYRQEKLLKHHILPSF